MSYLKRIYHFAEPHAAPPLLLGPSRSKPVASRFSAGPSWRRNGRVSPASRRSPVKVWPVASIVSSRATCCCVRALLALGAIALGSDPVELSRRSGISASKTSVSSRTKMLHRRAAIPGHAKDALLCWRRTSARSTRPRSIALASTTSTSPARVDQGGDGVAPLTASVEGFRPKLKERRFQIRVDDKQQLAARTSSGPRTPRSTRRSAPSRIATRSEPSSHSRQGAAGTCW